MSYKKRPAKDEYVEMGVTAAEKQGFTLSADLAAISLSSWIRERLRLAAIRELEGAGRRVPSVPEIPIGSER